MRKHRKNQAVQGAPQMRIVTNIIGLALTHYIRIDHIAQGK